MRIVRLANLQPKDYRRFKRPRRKVLVITKVILVIGLIGLSLLTYKVISLGKDSIYFWTQIKHLITSKDKQLKGEAEDRINVLLLGVGGIGHEGPYLSDTIILASFKPSTNQLAMLSIPRDLLVPIPDLGWRKINYAYAFGEANQPGTGGPLASEVISSVFDIPLHYYVRLDFAGFKKIIDDIGGITINVTNTIDDEFYPVPGKETATTSERYEHFYLEKGIRYMNGETALRYVRSRMAKGIEGSDFARSKRQQKVLLAVKDKILASSTLLNPGKISRIIRTLSNHLDMNLEIWEVLRLYSLGKSISSADIITQAINGDPDSGLLVATTIGKAFVLEPRTGDFSELQALAKNIFNPELKTSLKTSPASPPAATKEAATEREKFKKEEFKIEIYNGTKINGLAARTSQFLEKQGYNVIKIGNAPIQTYKKTLIYALKPDQVKNNILTDLEQKLAAIVFTSGPPAGLTDADGQSVPYPISPEADILIILGEDAETKF